MQYSYVFLYFLIQWTRKCVCKRILCWDKNVIKFRQQLWLVLRCFCFVSWPWSNDILQKNVIPNFLVDKISFTKLIWMKFRIGAVALLWPFAKGSNSANLWKDRKTQFNLALSQWALMPLIWGHLNVRGSEASVTILYDLSKRFSLWVVYKSQNPIGHCHLLCFLKWSILLYSELSSMLQGIEKGNHDDKEREKYCKRY